MKLSVRFGMIPNFDMVKRRRVKISTLGSRITSIISVSLVLFIVGLLVTLGIVTNKVTNSILADVNVIVKVDRLAEPADVTALGSELRQAPYASSVLFFTAQQVLEQEMDQNQETLALLDENPYNAEFIVNLRPAYATSDSIMQIASQLTLRNSVEDVVSQVDTVSAVNKATERITMGLALIAAVLLVISLVLIYNTVSVSVYGRRFVIRTMQLVGATSSFIRKPFVNAGIVQGVIAAVAASALLIAAQAYVSTLDINLYFELPWTQTLAVCGCMMALGVAICGFAAYCATNRYLSLSTDLLYE